MNTKTRACTLECTCTDCAIAGAGVRGVPTAESGEEVPGRSEGGEEKEEEEEEGGGILGTLSRGG